MLSFCSKLLYMYNPQISSWDLVFIRGLVSVAFISVKVKMNNINLFSFNNYGISLTIAVALAFLCYWFGLIAYRYISVAKATVIIYSNPIIVIIFAYFLLKESATKWDFISVILVIAGCYLITNSANSDESVDQDPLLGYIFAFANFVSMGISLVYLRRVNQQINHMIFIFYFFTIMVAQSLLIIVFTDLIKISNYGAIELLLLFASAVGGIIGQVFCGLAYKYVEASKLSPFWNLEIVFLCVLESILLNYKFSATDIAGGSMVIIAVVLTVLTKS